LRKANSKNVTVYDFSELVIYDTFNESFLTIFKDDDTYTGNIIRLN